MRRHYIIIVIINILWLAPSVAESDEWDSRALFRLRSIPSNPTPEDLEYVCSMASQEGVNDVTRNHVYSQALAKLYQLEDIEAEFEAYLKMNSQLIDGPSSTSAKRARYFVLGALGKVRHPDSVKVLGRMLTRVKTEQALADEILKGPDYLPFPSDGMLAARALYELIDNPPLEKKPNNYLESDVQHWITWWNEIQTGTRTFSFKGGSETFQFGDEGNVKEIGPKSQEKTSNPEARGSVSDMSAEGGLKAGKSLSAKRVVFGVLAILTLLLVTSYYVKKCRS